MIFISKRACGSSPRTWGTSSSSIRRVILLRFIPTHVGNMQSEFLIEISKSVHPHARGEHSCATHRADSPPGSSPRTWGTFKCAPLPVGLSRFIPTHVGNIHAPPYLFPPRPVHPHARGEHNDDILFIPRPPGSSPRTWGTFMPLPIYSLRARFIPTHVGNMPLRSRRRPLKAVHPHARGEHGGL